MAIECFEQRQRLRRPARRNHRASKVRLHKRKVWLDRSHALKGVDRVLVSPGDELYLTNLPLNIERQGIALQGHPQDAQRLVQPPEWPQRRVGVGTSDGWVTTMNGILATDATTFVPGHGDVQTRADLQKRAADMTARRDQIKALVAQGKSLDDVRASLGEQPPAARGGGGGGAGATGRGAAFPNFQDFTAVIVAEQTRK